MEKPKINVEELRRGGVVALKDDKFSVWVKTTCCNLNTDQIRKLADITDKYGRGFLLFTSRQIPIIPFIALKDIVDLKRELAEVEMDLDRCGARVRNLNVCYEDKICPHAVSNCISLGEKLESFFASQLMHKVKLGVVGCSRNCISVRTLVDIGFIGVQKDGIPGYDAYVGGKLGLNPFLGIKIAGHLIEDQCVKLVQNYFDLLEKQGQPGERAAEVIKRLGVEIFTQHLTKDLEISSNMRVIKCAIKVDNPQTDLNIIQIRATNGELTSSQLRQIAEVADKFGGGFIHFTVRGGPEIPGVQSQNIPDIRRKLKEVGLSLIENGFENMQACFGNYCLESRADPQSLLRKIEDRINQSGADNYRITISASGCPNSCGIDPLSDIGFHGMAEPEVDLAKCSGCGLCVNVCKRKAIEIKDKKAIIDKALCGHCGQCTEICPLSAITETRQGFAVLLGGKDGQESRLGTPIAEFVSEEEALKITEKLLSIVKGKKQSAAIVIDEIGINKIKKLITT